MPFGKEIKRLRLNAKWSAQKMADTLGVKAEKYRKWEQKDTDPKDEDQLLIENAFGISLEQLMKLEKLPKMFNGSVFIKDAPGLIISRLIMLEAKLNVLFSNEAEKTAEASMKGKTPKKATEVLREMNAAARSEADNLMEELRRKQ